MSAEIIKELDDYGAKKGGSACLVRVGDDYFVVSSLAAAFDHGGPETLAFASDANGEVSSFTDLAGGRGKSREETIAELVEIGPDEEAAGRGMFGDTKKAEDRDPGEVLAASLDSMAAMVKRTP